MKGRFTEHDIILMHDSGAKHTAAETLKEIIEWTMFSLGIKTVKMKFLGAFDEIRRVIRPCISCISSRT